MFPLKLMTRSLLLCSLIILGISAVLPLSSNLRSAGRQAARNILAAPTPDVSWIHSFTPISEGVSTKDPVILGWGGVTLDEASTGQMQTTIERLNQSGYDGIRVGFSAGVTQCSSGELGSWRPAWLADTIQIAQQYNFWVILDYHSYTDLVDGVCEQQWLSFWSGVLSTNWGYSRIVWEPINEPAGSVSGLSTAYQAWITQARTLGDTHWIAIENTISNDGCAFDPLSLVNCYPTVGDPLNQTFLSIHPYLFYDIWQSGGYGNCGPSTTNAWGNSTAECVANIYNQGMLQARASYHIPILDTEGGAVYYSCNNVCASPPDAVGIDDASYSSTTLHFIQYLTNQMGSEDMGWLWWEAGEGSCCGALDTWGNLLRFQPATRPESPDQPPILQTRTGLTVTVGSALSVRINASDPDLPAQNLTLSCINCPAGASFPRVAGLSHVTGVFTWAPSAAQGGKSYNITFIATDGIQSSSATLEVMVYPSNSPPNTSLPMGSPIVWLTVGGTAGLALLTASRLYRRRVAPAVTFAPKRWSESTNKV